MRWLAAALLVGCKPIEVVPTDTSGIPILEGPAIQHVPPEGPFVEDVAIAFEATASDADGVDAIDLYYRTSGELPYRVMPLDLAEDGVYRGEVPAVDVDAPGLEYYLRAFDRSDFRVPADLPMDGPDDPLELPVSVVPLGVPYVQPFDGTSTAFGVYEVGWTERALGFRGERWTVLPAFGVTGGAAVHGRGYDGIDPIDDWLVSPVLDFGGLVTAEVRFAQLGERTERIGRHSLWISTGSANPEDGDFVEVAALPDPPEGAWQTAPVVDLSPWAGEPAVALAWRYEGGDTDVWAIDDVRVRLFGPDLQLVSVDAPRLDPGTSAALDVTLANLGAPMSGPVTLTGAADPARAVFPDSSVLPALGTGESATVPLGIAVDPGHPDNTALPVVLSATDGTDGGTWPVDLLVGDPTRGIVRLHTLAPGLVRVWVGTGNPVQPHAEEPVFLGNAPAGVHTWQVDLSEHLQYLPSEPGRLRWWVKLETAAEASLVAFGIDFDGEVAWTDTVGPFPPNQTAFFYLPGRASPALVGGSSTPSPLVPGEPATLALTVRNDGGWTVGETRVRFSSPDPDLAVLAFDAPVAAAGWAPGEVVTIPVPVAIAAGHTDSTPLPLLLTFADTVETFALPVDVPVPWPDVAFGLGEIVDLGANGNGVLDPNETASVVVEVRNDGQLATGPLTCTFAQTGGPTITLLGTGAVSGPIAPGASVDLAFPLTASAGVVGDELVFAIACDDGRASWSGAVSVFIGGGGWTPFPLDPLGDHDGGPMDLREGRWRVDGDTLSIELTSAIPIDPSLNLEIWGISAGAPFTFHVVTLVNGVADLYGVRSGGFDPLGPVTVTFVGADTVRFDLDIPTMQLSATEFALGVGAGFCPTGDLYCDHWPDGWGNPYAGPPISQLWHVLDW